MMEPPQFLLETIGQCFLCLKKPAPGGSESGGGTSTGHQYHHVESLKTFSFRNICLYLNLDMKKVFPDDLADLEESEVKGKICKECSKIVETFSSLQFAKLEEWNQLKLNSCLKGMYRRMTEGVGWSKLEEFRKAMLRKPYTSFQFRIVAGLRTQMIDNCARIFEEAESRDPPVIVKEEASSSPVPVKEEVIPEEVPEQTLTSVSPPKSSRLGFSYKCLTCPRSFPTYRARVAHQQVCPQKVPSRLPTPIQRAMAASKLSLRARRRLPVPSKIKKMTKVKEEAPAPEEIFILPDHDIHGPDNGNTAPEPEEQEPAPKDVWESRASRDPQSGRWKCRTCSNDYSCKKSFQQHYQTIHLQARYKCFCGKEFRYRKAYRLHQMSAADSAHRFECDICGKEFMKQRSLVWHRQGTHFGRQYPCKFCRQLFSSPGIRSGHMTKCSARNGIIANATTAGRK